MRIPLGSKGPQTPAWVERELARFGKNPHGEPMFRVVWSENKLIEFDGQIVDEYFMLSPQWVLERWTPPEEDAGSQIMWEYKTAIGENKLGPYPRNGTYNICEGGVFVPGVPLNAQSMGMVCKLLTDSPRYSPEARRRAIQDEQKRKQQARETLLAEMAAAEQNSASAGAAVARVTQPVSGPNNNFKTVDDFQRECERGQVSADELIAAGFPTRGLKQG